jgi:peroxiredoxin
LNTTIKTEDSSPGTVNNFPYFKDCWMALEYSTMVPLGTPARDFNLKGVDGKIYNLARFNGIPALAIIFMCNHCPYVKAVIQRLIDLQNKLGPQGVQLLGINCNDADRYPEDSFENMQKWTREANISFPYLYDETQQVAKNYDAVCTPDIFVYGPDRTLKYRGRIDDNWKEPEKVTKQDLKDALKKLIAGKEISSEQISSMGCSIKWKK